MVSRPALLLAILILTAGAAGADDIQTGVSGLHYGASAAPSLACKASKLAAATDHWTDANAATVESGGQRRLSLSFPVPLATDVFRVDMNGAGMRDLALVEIQGTDGAWRKAWEGALGAPAANFWQTCFEQQLPQKQVVQALRFTFRSGPGEIEVNQAALLRR